MKILKKIIWTGDSLKNLQHFPDDVKDSVGYSLQKIQEGLTPRNTKQLKSLNPSTIEIIADDATGTYRVMYTLKIDSNIYVLHCFQKKSKQGIKTPKQEIDLIKQRLQDAKTISKQRGYSQ